MKFFAVNVLPRYGISLCNSRSCSLKNLYGGTDNTPLKIELYRKEKLEIEFQTEIKFKEMDLAAAVNSQALEMDFKKSVEERKFCLEERKTSVFFVVGLVFCAAIYFGLSGYVLSFHQLSVGVIGISHSLSKISDTVTKIGNILVANIVRNIGRSVLFGLPPLLMYITYKLPKI
jgi:hypothetical protein